MQVAPIPVDSEGIVVDSIPDAARLVHVTPSHQFPLGVSMSLPRRLVLQDPVADAATRLHRGATVAACGSERPGAGGRPSPSSSTKGCWRNICAACDGRTPAGTTHHHLAAALQRDFGGYLNPIESLVGLHVTALLNPAVAATDVQVVERARERGVECLPLSMFATHGARQGLILGYGRVPVDRMPEALARLRQCVA